MVGEVTVKRMIDSFTKSYFEHPALTGFVIVICASMGSGLLGWSAYTFAEKVTFSDHVVESDERFEDLNHKISNGYGSIKLILKNQEIRSISYKIDDYEQLIESGNATQADRRRLVEAKNDLREVENTDPFSENIEELMR